MLSSMQRPRLPPDGFRYWNTAYKLVEVGIWSHGSGGSCQHRLPIYRASIPLNIHHFWLSPLPSANVTDRALTWHITILNICSRHVCCQKKYRRCTGRDQATRYLILDYVTKRIHQEGAGSIQRNDIHWIWPRTWQPEGGGLDGECAILTTAPKNWTSDRNGMAEQLGRWWVK